MRTISACRSHRILVLLALMLLIPTGCGQPAGEAAVAPAAPAATPTPEAPAAVLQARDAVLDFVREGAIICVPPAGVAWRTQTGGAETPPGFAVYRFQAQECTLTIAFAEAAPADTLFNVAVNNPTIGFCWQAVVDASGRVVKTGNAAQMDPGEGNPAAVYCTQQGHRYEIRSDEEGAQCGACVFADGSACKGWDYFFGDCQPGDNQTISP